MQITSFVQEYYPGNLSVNSWGNYHLQSRGLKIKIEKASNNQVFLHSDCIWLYEDGSILAANFGKYFLLSKHSTLVKLDYISKEIFDGKYRITKDTDDADGKDSVCLIYNYNGRSVFKANHWKKILSVDNNIMTVEIRSDVYTILPVKDKYSLSDTPFEAQKITKISDDLYEYVPCESYETKEFAIPDSWKVRPSESMLQDDVREDDKRRDEADKIRIIFDTMIEQGFNPEDSANAILVLTKNILDLLPITNVSIDHPEIINDANKPLPGKEDEAKKLVVNDILNTPAIPIRRRKKNATRPIYVIFEDGTVFNDKQVVDVYEKTIEKIGIQKVKALGIEHSGNPLIASHREDISKDGGYFNSAHQLSNGMWLLTKTSTLVKMADLRDIAIRTRSKLEVGYQSEESK